MTHPAAEQISRFEELNKSRKDLMLQLDFKDSGRPCTPHKEQKLKIDRLTEIKNKLQEVRSETCSLMRRNRTIQNNWKAGIVGVEQFTDAGEDSSLYQS